MNRGKRRRSGPDGGGESPSAGHTIPGRQPVLEALRAGRAVTEVALEAGGRNLGTMIAAAEQTGVRFRFVPRAELDELVHGVTHQGVGAVAGQDVDCRWGERA